jgi:Protein of unknown function (DUF2934)
MKQRLIVLEDEIAVLLTLRDLEHLQDAFRSQHANPRPFIRQVSMDSNHPEAVQEEIRQRAHELYQERGCEPGYAEQDWLRAEAEILARRRANKQAEAA